MGPVLLLKCIGKAALKAAIKAIPFGDVVVDLAKEVYQAWSKEKQEQERIKEIQDIANANPAEFRAQVAEIVKEIAADQPATVKESVTSYLTQVPAAIHQSLRRTSDPTGTTIPAALSLAKPEDLIPFLPTQIPRFKPGDRPLPGVDWELVELLGTGGFGEVWKARNPHFDGVPPAALKFCLDSTAKDRLLRHEAAILNQVMRQGTHAGIVALKHTYLSADPPCLEYEYVEGGNLAGLIKEWHRMGSGAPPRQAAQIIHSLAEIVGFAHRLIPAIVHRDLKPANILIQKINGKIVFRIADFGIGAVAAKQSLEGLGASGAENQTFFTRVRGAYTPLYSSPQQRSGEEPDPRDDVHALGVVWFQLLTGDLLKAPPTGKAWERRLVEKGMPTTLLDLLRSCVEEEPSDRPDNASILAERLAVLLRKETEDIPSHASGRPVADSPNGVHQTRTFLGHSGGINCLAFVPDGRLFLSGSNDCTVRVWDVEAGQEKAVLEGHTLMVHSVACSPNGRVVASGGLDNAIRVWSIETAKQLYCIDLPGKHGVDLVAFSPDGRVLVSAVGDARLWDAETGNKIRRFGIKNRIFAFSPDGRFIVSADVEGTLRSWDLITGQEVRRFEGHKGLVGNATFSPDGSFLVSEGVTDFTVRVWDTKTGRERSRYEGLLGRALATFSGHEGRTLAVSPDGQLVLSAGGSQTIQLWKFSTGTLLYTFPGQVSCFSPDGKSVLCANSEFQFEPLKRQPKAAPNPHFAIALWRLWTDCPDAGRMVKSKQRDGRRN